MDPEYQQSQEELRASAEHLKAEAQSFRATAEEFAQQLNAQLAADAPVSIPKGFIEVTIPTEKKDKVLIAVRTIGSIRPIDWMETPRASISFKDDFTRSTEPNEQEVLESYDELKRLLAAAY